MGSIDEKRVFSDALDTTRLVVASSLGIVYVDVVEDRIGEYGILRRGRCRDITHTDAGFAAATDEDVILLTESGFEATHFGPAAAVGYHDSQVIAAADTGRVASYGSEWIEVGTVPPPVNAIDGQFIATDEGVYRLSDELRNEGLSDVRDVSTGPVPLAGTDHGLYELRTEWLRAHDGDFRFVSNWLTDPSDRAYAGTCDECYERSPTWVALALPVDEPVIDVTYTTDPFFVTSTGSLVVRGEDGWRSTSLGVQAVTGIASPIERKPGH